MSTSAAQAAAFYTEVVREGTVWSIKDDDGLPAPITQGGQRAMPFWSLRSRAERIIATVPAYAGFTPLPIELEVFRSRWLPGLRRDGLHVGINWAGRVATGYDLEPSEVERHIAAVVTRNHGP